MKVRALMAILEGLDADAEVFVMSQRSYPFECEAVGVAVREDFTDCEGEDDHEEQEEGRAMGDRWTARASALPPNDVFILEGPQVRYGSSEAWRARR